MRGEFEGEMAMLAELADQLEDGSDPNAPLESGSSPLVSAVGIKEEYTIRALLEENAEPNRHDPQGSLLLVDAASMRIVQALLDAGTDPELPDSDSISTHMDTQRSLEMVPMFSS